MRFVFPIAVLLLSMSCGKKTYEPYYAIERQEKQLVEELGDDAWDSPQMRVIVQALDEVPADTKEKERAVALVQTIAIERMRAQKAALAKAAVVPPKLIDTPAPIPREDIVVAPGATRAPGAGMTLESFQATYGTCFAQGEPTTVGGAQATTLVALTDGSCGERFGRPGVKTVWMFVEGKLWGTRVEMAGDALAQGGLDASSPDAPPREDTPRPPNDGGMIIIPGAPLPPGLGAPPVAAESAPPSMVRADAGLL